MKKTIIAVSLLALTNAASAIDGTIHFSGAFTDAPCEININGSQANSSNSVSVNLDTWSTASYQNNVGATTDLKPITISLSNCPNMTQANIRFSGAVDATNPELFAIDTGVETASNVGIGIYKSSNTADIISPNDRTVSIPLTAQTGDYTFYASYMTTGSSVGEGAANADVTLDISYE